MCLFDNVCTIYPAQLLSEPTFQDTILTFLIKHPVALLSSPWDVVLIFTLPTKNSNLLLILKPWILNGAKLSTVVLPSCY